MRLFADMWSFWPFGTIVLGLCAPAVIYCAVAGTIITFRKPY